MVTIRVPASSANMGPGFDSFGCALSLFNTYTFELADTLEIRGCPQDFCNEGNLSVVAFKETLKKMGKEWRGLKLTVDSKIPFSSGLGSSAAMIVAGARGANALYGEPLSQQELFEICTAIEEHPDNIAPALFGGLTVSFMNEGKPVTVQYPVCPELHFIALTPDFPLCTKAARRILPKAIGMEEAVFNASRTGIMPHALATGDERLLRLALQDKLHEPYRRKLITDFDDLEQKLLQEGAITFCISGAGPTCLCLTKDPLLAKRLGATIQAPHSLWTVRDLDIAAAGSF